MANRRLLNWDLHDFVCFIGVAVIIVIIFSPLLHGLQSLVVCPDHGVKASYTGNRKIAGKKWYCEYSHPRKDISSTTHKFWSECD